MAQTKVKYPGLIDFETVTVDFLVIAGGGGGPSGYQAGGGGAGGYRASYNNETSGGGGSSENSINASIEKTVKTIEKVN